MHLHSTITWSLCLYASILRAKPGRSLPCLFPPSRHGEALSQNKSSESTCTAMIRYQSSTKSMCTYTVSTHAYTHTQKSWIHTVHINNGYIIIHLYVYTVIDSNCIYTHYRSIHCTVLRCLLLGVWRTTSLSGNFLFLMNPTLHGGSS